MKNEKIYFDTRAGAMVINTPEICGHEVEVDNAVDAANFWNEYKNDFGGLIRDPYNNHYWSTASARQTLIAARKKAQNSAPAPEPAPEQSDTLNVESIKKIQLWEPCEKCGTEPSYATARGVFCSKHS